MSQLGGVGALVALAVVVLVAVVVALVLVAAIQLGLWITLSKLSRRLDRYAAPRPNRSPRQ